MTEQNLNQSKQSYEMLATYLNIVAKSENSKWRYKVVLEEEL